MLAGVASHDGHVLWGIVPFLPGLFLWLMRDWEERANLRPHRLPLPAEHRPWVEMLAVATGLTLVAGAVHATVAPNHFEEGIAVGAFFVVAAVAQFATALWVATCRHRLAFSACATTNLALVAVWAVSRAIGLPVGGEAGEVEAVGAADLVTVAAEAGAAVVSLLLLRGPVLPRPGRLLTGSLRPPLVTAAAGTMAVIALLA